MGAHAAVDIAAACPKAASGSLTLACVGPALQPARDRPRTAAGLDPGRKGHLLDWAAFEDFLEFDDVSVGVVSIHRTDLRLQVLRLRHEFYPSRLHAPILGHDVRDVEADVADSAVAGGPLLN